MIAANAQTKSTFPSSAGMPTMSRGPKGTGANRLAVDCANKDGLTRELVRNPVMTPPVPPQETPRKLEWKNDGGIFKMRNELERQFGRLRSCRHVFTQSGKLDFM